MAATLAEPIPLILERDPPVRSNMASPHLSR
jgi:hypothetical protein